MSTLHERQAWCCLQVKLCDPCLSALCVPWFKKALLFLSFPFFYTERLQLLYARCDFAANARSRSAPARGYLSDGAHRTRAWPPFLDEPVEIKVYDVDDVERLARWRAQEAEVGLQALSRHEWSVKLSLGFNRPYFQVRRVTVFISRPTFVAYRYHCVWSTVTGLIPSV